MKKRVAIIDPLGAHGSSHHYYLYGQSIGLLNNKCEVRIYTNKETQNPNIPGLGFYTFFGSIFSSKRKILSGIKYLLGSVHSILHARINGCIIFHFHVFHSDLFVLYNMILVKILFGRNVITIHDVHSFKNKKDNIHIVEFIYKLANIVITHNDFSKKEVLSLTDIKENKIKVIPHGNYNLFLELRYNKVESRQVLNIAQNKKVLLFFGMIKKVKGLEILLKALIKIKDYNPDIFLVIAGKAWNNDFTNYQQIIDKNNLQDYCLIHNNYISDEKLPYYYLSSDLVVLPYREIYQSGVLMMALSFEKAVLASNLKPNKEMIKDNHDGFLFETGDAESLADKIITIFSDKVKLDTVSKNGAILAKEKYNWNDIGSQLTQAYQML